MFTIRANYHDSVEIKTNLENAKRFFTDVRNFVEMMPGIESIHTDASGIAHWKVRADVPVVGSFIQKFAVRLIENEEDRVEWLPALGETQNLLRYASDFAEKSPDTTLIQITLNIEMRRQSARELHTLAGLAGESIISSEMSRSLAEMMKTFVRKAKTKLENG